jgi:hypothetical protein
MSATIVTIHAVLEMHSSFSLDMHWSRRNETYVCPFYFRMVSKALGKKNYRLVVSILKPTAKEPKNCAVNL